MGRKRAQIAGTIFITLIAVGGVAVPTATAADPPVMPDVVGMTLDGAQAEVNDASGDPNLVLNTQNVGGPTQQQLVPKFWKVCWQSPKAGEPMSADAWYGVGVIKNGSQCW